MVQNNVILRYQNYHILMSLGVNEVSKQLKRAVPSKQMSEWCERMSEQTSEWPSIYVSNSG